MSPSKNHSLIQVKLASLLDNLEQYSTYSELSIEIEGKEYIPDISVYPKDKFAPFHDIVRMTEIPLLTVEILSPSQIIQELTDKIEVYLNAGVKSCWLVIPITCTVVIYHELEKPAEVSVLNSQDKVIDKILDISLPLNKIFPF